MRVKTCKHFLKIKNGTLYKNILVDKRAIKGLDHWPEYHTLIILRNDSLIELSSSLTLCMLGNFHDFLSSTDFFSKLTFSNTISVKQFGFRWGLTSSLFLDANIWLSYENSKPVTCQVSWGWDGPKINAIHKWYRNITKYIWLIWKHKSVTWGGDGLQTFVYHQDQPIKINEIHQMVLII